MHQRKSLQVESDVEMDGEPGSDANPFGYQIYFCLQPNGQLTVLHSFLDHFSTEFHWLLFEKAGTRSALGARNRTIPCPSSQAWPSGHKAGRTWPR